MSDPDFSPDKILVDADPARSQVAAGIRQLAAALSIIAATMGATALAGKFNLVVALAPQIAVVVTILGPMVWGVVTWLGQLSTRRHAQQVAKLVPLVSDDVASFK